MTLSILTTTGLICHSDIASIEDYTEVDGREVIHLTPFNPKMEDILLDKKTILLIQVVK